MGDFKFIEKATRDASRSKPRGSDFVHEIRGHGDGTVQSTYELVVRLSGLHPDVYAVRLYGFLTPRTEARGSMTYMPAPEQKVWQRIDWLQTAFVEARPDGTAEARIPVAFGTYSFDGFSTVWVKAHFYVASLADSVAGRSPVGTAATDPVAVLSFQAVAQASVRIDWNFRGEKYMGITGPVPFEPVLCGSQALRSSDPKRVTTLVCELHKPAVISARHLVPENVTMAVDHHRYFLPAFSLQALPRERAIHKLGPTGNPLDIGVDAVLKDQSELGVKMFNRRTVPSLMTGEPLPVEAHYLAHWLTAPAGGDPRAWEEALMMGALSIGLAPDTVTPASVAATLSLLTALAPYKTDRRVDGTAAEIFAYKGVTTNPLASGDCEDGATSAIVLARALEYQRLHPYEQGSNVEKAQEVLNTYHICAADCEIIGKGGKKSLHACALLLRRDVLYHMVSADDKDKAAVHASTRCQIPDDRYMERYEGTECVYLIETVVLSEPRDRAPENPDARSRVQQRVSDLFARTVHNRDSLFEGVQFMHRSPGSAGYKDFFRVYIPELSFRINLPSLTPVVTPMKAPYGVEIGLGFDKMMQLGTREFFSRGEKFYVTPEESPRVAIGPSGLKERIEMRPHVAEIAEKLVLDAHVPVPPLRPTRELNPGDTVFPSEFRGATDTFFLYTRWFEDRASQISRIASLCGAKVDSTFPWQNYTVHVLVEAE